MDADWVYLPDAATGCSYYVDLLTGATSWERPPVLDTAPSPRQVEHRKSLRRRSATKHAWIEYYDDAQGLPYYHNAQTGESVWVLPADDDDDEDVDEEEVMAAEAEAARRARHREHIVEEILSTEQTYVHALHTLMKVYIHPLRAVADAGAKKGAIFTQTELDAIFLNIEVWSRLPPACCHRLLPACCRPVAHSLPPPMRR